MRSTVTRWIGFAVAFLVLWPMAASAQSAIAGVVKDASGAVLPGVTVEASSSALIEKTRSAVTDAQGAYKIVDLRPGTYALTFSLEGFNTFKRDGVDLPSSFVATINAELKVGTITETIVVTGESPVVDVQSNTRAANLPRDVLDSVPNSHTLQSVGQLVVGVTLTAPDVGGSQAMQQTYFTVHGAGAAQTAVLMDGMIVNGLQGDGAIQSYMNDAGAQEMVYQTGGGAADSTSGGVRINLVPKEGGNTFRGSLYAGFERSGAFPGQSDNLSDFLASTGVKTLDKIGLYRDINPTFGGPIRRDKIWFFAAGRLFTVNKPISNTFHVPAGQTYANCVNGVIACEQGVDNQKINSALGRVTWQASPRNKFSVYADKIWKTRGAAMSPGDDPDTSSVVWTSPLYLTDSVKWSSPVSSKLLVEGGFSSNIERYENLDQPGIAQDWGTPAWFAGAPYRDAGFGTTSHAASIVTGGGEYQKSPDRYNLQGSATYVTGSHSVKVGIQHSWGRDGNTLRQNADLVQNYQNGAPLSVILEGTANPRTYWTDRLNANVGIYAQDQWTMKRLTISYALRWEYVNEQVDGQPAQVGRFANILAFGDIKMPIWTSWSPRGSLVYDLTGDGKTAVRFGFNRFQSAATTTFASLYDPANALNIQTTAPWNDKNKDNIATGVRGCNFATDPTCEINFATVPSNFGTISLSTPDPNVTRPYVDAYNVGVTREVWRGVSLSFDWYRNYGRNLLERNNILRPGVLNADGTVTNASYRPVTIFSPIDGHAITMYDTVSAAAQQAVANVDTNDSNLKQRYDGFEFNFTARLPKGGRLFGGTATDRSITNTCSSATTNPNLLNYCDQTLSGIPWRTQLKIAATYEIPWGVRVSGALQSLPGYVLGTQSLQAGGAGAPNLTTVSGLGTAYTVTPAIRYLVCPGSSASQGCTVGALVVPGMNSATFSVPLIAPGTENTPRINQLDLAVSKRISLGRLRVEPKLDVFNVLNSSDYFSVRSTTFSPTAVPGVPALGAGGAPTAYLAPASILQGRLARVSVTLNW
jgi:hypothetical protein